MSPLRRLLPYMAKYRSQFLAGLVCVVLTTAISQTAPLVLRAAIDDLTLDVTRRKLLLYSGLILAIGLVGGVFRFLMRRILTGVSRHIEYDMRNDFFAHLQRMPLGYFQAHRTGDLMSRATNDLNAVRMMVGPAVMYSANTVLGFAIALTMMFAIDARLTLWSLLPMPFVSLSVKYFGSAIHKRFETIQAQLSDVSAVTQEALAGVRVVRAYRQEAAETDRFRRSNAEYLRRNYGLIALQGFFFPSMSFFLGLGALLVLWLGSQDVIRGRITVGEFVAFNAYLTMLSWPLIAFGWVTNMLQRGMASWGRMLEVLDEPPAITDAPGAQRYAGLAIHGAIELRDLTFGYGGAPVLDRVSLTIPAGRTAALVGLTGAGKTTLLNLIARLHEPPPGAVFVDGIDVRDLPLAVLRRAIGFVPQEPFLFSDTLGNNIAYGLDGERLRPERGAGAPNAAAALGWPAGGQPAGGRPPSESERGWGPASRKNDGAGGAGRAGGSGGDAVTLAREQRILRAAEISRLDKDVADFPHGYETRVGERGLTLSGGQKQRTAIARALAIDPKILILDDALSAVDTYTEEEILSRLRGVMRERTSILVSHRISTVRDADEIFVLDAGRIVERGTHDELVAANGLYADLYRKQLLEEELAAS